MGKHSFSLYGSIASLALKHSFAASLKPPSSNDQFACATGELTTMHSISLAKRLMSKQRKRAQVRLENIPLPPPVPTMMNGKMMPKSARGKSTRTMTSSMSTNKSRRKFTVDHSTVQVETMQSDDGCKPLSICGHYIQLPCDLHYAFLGAWVFLRSPGIRHIYSVFYVKCRS